MNLTDRIEVFSALQQKLQNLPEEHFDQLAGQAYASNKWFTDANVRRALDGIVYMLDEHKMAKWLSRYDLQPVQAKRVGIVMAGNIPLVGFHDLLCTLLSGHHAYVKMSSQDQPLTQWILDTIDAISPQMSAAITTRDRLSDIDAVIATGSDNSSRYFEYYFGKYPHIIRKNRTSIGILTGDESDEELLRLGIDVFAYFGLGCRNVSKLYVPPHYDFRHMLDIWQAYNDILDHYKYKNNYDYHKSILLVNREPHLDTGFSLLRQTDQLVSPLSVTYYETYDDSSSLDRIIMSQQDKIQCIVSRLEKNEHVKFGEAQFPELWDYADGIDTLDFLIRLSRD